MRRIFLLKIWVKCLNAGGINISSKYLKKTGEVKRRKRISSKNRLKHNYQASRKSGTFLCYNS